MHYLIYKIFFFYIETSYNKLITHCVELHTNYTYSHKILKIMKYSIIETKNKKQKMSVLTMTAYLEIRCVTCVPYLIFQHSC